MLAPPKPEPDNETRPLRVSYFENVQLSDIQSMARIFQQLQPQTEAHRREVGTAMAEVRRILTEEQWEKVPARVRNPFAFILPRGMFPG